MGPTEANGLACIGLAGLYLTEAQQSAYQAIEGMLTEEEAGAYRRGRNANKVTASRHADSAAYRSSTGLESLFGYLYLTGRTGRIEELFSAIAANAEAEP